MIKNRLISSLRTSITTLLIALSNILALFLVDYISSDFTILGFEVWMMHSSPFDPVTANWIRAALKIGVGTSSAITIFLANYYGKMSLSSKIDEHLRMHWLYNTVEYEIMERKEEDEELIMHLAREFLIENAIWYSHQKKNKPDFAVE